MTPDNPPFQWSAFIRDNPIYAKPRPGAVGTMAELTSVNERANEIEPSGEFPPVSQAWLIHPPLACCGDYATTKYVELLAGNWPSSALQLAECLTPEGQEHCVLIVTMPDGEHVLDNRTSAIRPPNRTGLKFLCIQSATDPQMWERLAA